MTNLTDLARMTGLSVSTISRALAGKTVVAEATRERVKALAEEHGVILNQSARNLRLGRTGAIGVILPLGHEVGQSLSDPFFMALLGPLADAIAERGHDLLLSRVIPTHESWLERVVDSGRFDGVVLIGQSNEIEAIEAVASQYQPLVVWGAAVPGLAQTTVGTDNLGGGRTAADYLLSQGRRRLAFFGNVEAPEFAARFEGFRQATAAAGAEPPLLLPMHITSQEAHAAVAAWVNGNRPAIDGVLCASDVIAMSALRALDEQGIRVPDDVAVVGYDDVMIARMASPPLTTLRQDVEAGGHLLVDLLFRKIAGEAVQSVKLAPELVVRESA